MLLIELLLQSSSIRNSANNKESFKITRARNDSKPNSNKIVLHTTKRIVIGIILGIIAFYLSWECNTVAGYSTIEKACYGLFAFLFGGVYIIMYLIFRAGTCAVGNRTAPP